MKNKVEYSNDLIHGQWIEYYLSGKINSITNYIFGEKNGLEIFYYENGFKKTEQLFKDNNPFMDIIRWKSNGEIIQ